MRTRRSTSTAALTGKGSRYVEVSLDAFDDHLNLLGFTPDESAAIRSGAVEVSYSKVVRLLTQKSRTRFTISVARADTGALTGKGLQVDAADIDECVKAAIKTAQQKCAEACEGADTRAEHMRIVYPKGIEGNVLWVIQNLEEVCGKVLVRVYTSVTTKKGVSRGAGEDAIRVCVLYQSGNGPEGPTRGLGHETRVNRVGSVEGVMYRVTERIVEAEALKLAWCPRCGGPAYADSGNCIDKACRASGVVLRAGQTMDKVCAHCQGPTYADSGRCVKKTCPGYKVQQAWAKGGPCQACSGDTYTDSKKCIDRKCREHGGCAAPVGPSWDEATGGDPDNDR